MKNTAWHDLVSLEVLSDGFLTMSLLGGGIVIGMRSSTQTFQKPALRAEHHFMG
jgi:hypothetical protein